MVKAQLKRNIRYSTKIFEKGTVGEITKVKEPLTFKGEPVFDFYVQFDNHKPIGMFKHEVNILEDK